jgi:hypothetical protein
MFGMVGRAVQEGYSARRALEFMTRHTLLMVGGGIAVGGVATGAMAQRFLPGTELPVAITVTLSGVAIGTFAVSSTLGWPRRLLLAAAATATWLLLGITMWWTVGSGLGSPLMMTSAFAAAWVAGLLVLPVPAGLGVREAALVYLLVPELGQEGAIAFALITRLLHVLSDAMVALSLLGFARWRARQGVGSEEYEPT